MLILLNAVVGMLAPRSALAAPLKTTVPDPAVNEPAFDKLAAIFNCVGAVNVPPELILIVEKLVVPIEVPLIVQFPATTTVPPL